MQQIEFLHRQIRFGSLDQYPSLLRINLQTVKRDYWLYSPFAGDIPGFRRCSCSCLNAGSPQNILDAQDQLTGTKRFGQIIVRSHGETQQPVGFLAAGRQHDDRRILLLPNPVAHLKTAKLRHHEIQHQQVGMMMLPMSQRFVPVSGNPNRPALPL
ncbi:hypothetical protein D3C81_764770 [compost metagenome]